MEIKLYEKIGVRHFKNFLMWLEAKLIPNPEYRKVFNYNLMSRNLTSVKQFKKMLILNGSVHSVGVIYCFLMIIASIRLKIFFSLSTLAFIAVFMVNLYCVLLQRYNWIRINKVLKKKKLIDESKSNNDSN